MNNEFLTATKILMVPTAMDRHE